MSFFKFLFLIGVYVQTLTLVIGTNLMLQRRRNRTSLQICWSIFLCWLPICWAALENTPGNKLIMAIGLLVLWSVCVWIGYEDSLFHKMIVMLMQWSAYWIIQILVEYLAEALYKERWEVLHAFGYHRLMWTVSACILLFLTEALLTGLYDTWIRRTECRISIGNLMIIALLPITQTVMLLIIDYHKQSTVSAYYLGLIFLVLVLDIFVDVMWCVYVYRMNRAVIEAEKIRQLEQQKEEQRIKLASFEEASKDMARIRHDYHNQIDTIHLLIRQGRQEDAAGMVAELLKEIDGKAAGE